MPRRSSKLFIPPALAVMVGLSAWAGCSASTEGDEAGSGFDNPSSTSGSGASGAAGGSGGRASSDGGAGTGGIPFNPSTGGSGGVETCAESESLAAQKTLDIIVVLDRSGSMLGAKWDGSVTALSTFVNDPASAGINVGIIYFPQDGASDSCNIEQYKNVNAFGPLPQNAPAFISSLDEQDADGSDTPISAALTGSLFAATALQDANPEHKVILVFASDGDPSACDTVIANIANIAEQAYNYNGLQTYVVAIQGATVTNLDQIAAKGGTGQAYDVTANIQAFADKMAEIRATAVGCEITIPEPPQSEVFDKDLVNVNYTPGGMGEAVKLPKKLDKADCGAGPGWYYDDENNPTEIIFCPASCQTVQADTKAKINVGFGCESVET
ncbi:MAG: vWA domain-containing protein [Polyangiaceae bacterium]